MIRFLIHKPIAVFMTFIALLIFGIISVTQIPVSLLPDIEIPEISVHVLYSNYNAREFDDVITQRLIRQIRQCSNIEDITSKTEDGKAVIKLRFKYGINTDLAAIEVDEKIDLTMNQLPEGIERPKVIKSSLTDIPAFYLNLKLRKAKKNTNFLELSQLAEDVISKRIDHLPEVAFVDITGTEKAEITIIPDEFKLKALGINVNVIEQAFNDNNLQFGTVEVNQGNYRYSIRFQTKIFSIEEISNLFLRADGRLIKLNEVAKIEFLPRKKNGLFISDGAQSISMAIIKQPDAKIDMLKRNVEQIIKILEKQYPQIEFEITQDQTMLLNYSISNLKQDLLAGTVLAIIVVFLFISNIKLPIIIGLSVPVSLIISMLFFKIFHVTFNIISLSGLVLGVGMMIDNSIIIIDNITQHWQRKAKIADACIIGTNEIIRTLLSSTLTNIAVYIPLVFMSGLIGGLLFDQAISIAIGLAVSYLVAIILLPVLYFSLFKGDVSLIPSINTKSTKFSLISPFEKIYTTVIEFVFKRKLFFLLFFPLLALSSIFLFKAIKKERFPYIEQNEIMLSIDFNENINLESIKNRVDSIIYPVKNNIKNYNLWIGVQDYYFNKGFDLSSSQAKMYIVTENNQLLVEIQKKINATIKRKYQNASVEFSPADNIFENTFSDKDNNFEIRIYPGATGYKFDTISSWVSFIKSNGKVFDKANKYVADNKEIEESLYYTYYYSLEFSQEKLLLYNVNLLQLTNELQSRLNSFRIGTLNSRSQVIPVVIGGKSNTLEQIINSSMIRNGNGDEIPIRELVKVKNKKDYKQITAGLDGTYIPISFDVDSKNREEAESFFRTFLTKNKFPLTYSFNGSLYRTEKIIMGLVVVLMISILLLFFILTTQFESVLQPLIILSEIPINISGTLFLLYICGESLNIMSGIGIIVMSGIVINDSILKISTINRLRRHEGFGLTEAIKEAGHRTLRPIIMTAFTTILAIVPFLFGNGLGSDLQRPFSLALIGGLGIGTIVSLFFIPLLYWFIHRKDERNNEKIIC